MGSVFEINLVSGYYIEISGILDQINILFNRSTKIQNIQIMDDWEYNNVICLENLTSVRAFIMQNKITCIEFCDESDSNMGIYIEKQEDVILYNFWIDTSNYPLLDIDIVDSKNQIYYDNIYEAINVVDKKNNHCIKLAALGVETDFKFSKEFNLVIADSYNINAWLISRDLDIYVNDFQEKHSKSGEMKIFEKVCI